MSGNLEQVSRQIKTMSVLEQKQLRSLLDELLTHSSDEEQDAMSKKQKLEEVLRTAGLHAEPGDKVLALAAESKATLEEVQAAFKEAGGQPLSEIVNELRDAKE